MRDIQLFSYNSAEEKFTPSSIGEVRGRDRLAQKVAKFIFQEVGSNWWDRDTGSEFAKVFRNVDPRQQDDVKNQLPIMLRSIETQIKSAQSEDLPLYEKLSKLVLRQATLDISLKKWDIIVDIYTEAGDIIAVRT